jgi:CHASE3 domain sensor protein
LKSSYKIWGVLAVALLLVALGTLSLFWAYGQIEQAAEKRQHNHIVISQAQELMSELKDAETGQRGYSLTGDEAF